MHIHSIRHSPGSVLHLLLILIELKYLRNKMNIVALLTVEFNKFNCNLEIKFVLIFNNCFQNTWASMYTY